MKQKLYEPGTVIVAGIAIVSLVIVHLCGK